MKKRLLALLMAGVLTFSLTACGSGNKTQESNQTGTEQQVVTQDTTEEAKDIAEMSFDEMKEAAKILEFEHAAYLRDKIEKLKSIM